MMKIVRNLKVCIFPFNNRFTLDMIFSEDAILLSLFNIYEDENELKEAVLKYCHGGVLEVSRPTGIDATKGDATELDQVNYFYKLILSSLGYKPNR